MRNVEAVHVTGTVILLDYSDNTSSSRQASKVTASERYHNEAA
jgi:hypothetical protein